MKTAIILTRTNSGNEFRSFADTHWFNTDPDDTLIWTNNVDNPTLKVIVLNRAIENLIAQNTLITSELEATNNQCIVMWHNHPPNREFVNALNCCKLSYSSEANAVDFLAYFFAERGVNLKITHQGIENQVLTISNASGLSNLYDFLQPYCNKQNKLDTALEVLHTLLNGPTDDIPSLSKKLNSVGFIEFETIINSLRNLHSEPEGAYITQLSQLRDHLLRQVN